MRARKNGQPVIGSMLPGVVLTTLLLGAMGLVLASPTPARAQAASITSVSPAAARPGERVTITGIGFGAMNVRITVGGVTAQVVFALGDIVTFVVPPSVSVGPTTVTATNPGGRLGTIGFRVLLGLTVDGAASAQAIIGPDGGAVRTQWGGITYELNIPVAALDADTTITLAPVTSMTRLPFSGDVLAAAQFEPSGLHLNRPGTLTITFPQPVDPTALVAFLIDDQGLNLEVSRLAAGLSTVTLPVDHFTVGGTARAAVADLEQFLATIPPSLPPTQVASLVSLFIDLVGPAQMVEVCSQTDLCTRVFDFASRSLAASQAQALTQAQSFVQHGEPFLAFNQLAVVIKIATGLFDLKNLAAQVGLPGFDDPFDLTCTQDVLKSIVDLAAAQAIANPRAGLLLLFPDVARNATLLSFDDLRAYADGKFLDVLNKIVAKAERACLDDPVAGESFLDLITNNFDRNYLEGLDTGLADRVHDTGAGCRIRIDPALPTVSLQDTLQFTAATVGLSPSGVTWSLQSPTLGSTIEPETGLFTAGQFEGVVVVRATSVADSSLFKRVSVSLETDIHITINPSAAILSPAGTAQFVATVVGTNNPAVTWTATGGNIISDSSTTATYTAGSTVGTFSVKATSVVEPTQSQTVAVTIGGASIVSPDNAKVVPGGTLLYHAPGAGTGAMFTWTATGGTITPAPAPRPPIPPVRRWGPSA